MGFRINDTSFWYFPNFNYYIQLKLQCYILFLRIVVLHVMVDASNTNMYRNFIKHSRIDHFEHKMKLIVC